MYAAAPEIENSMMSAAPRKDIASADSAGRPRRVRYSTNVCSRTPQPFTETGSICTMNDTGIRIARCATGMRKPIACAMAE